MLESASDISDKFALFLFVFFVLLPLVIRLVVDLSHRKFSTQECPTWIPVTPKAIVEPPVVDRVSVFVLKLKVDGFPGVFSAAQTAVVV
jgi:hypothetical protein